MSEKNMVTRHQKEAFIWRAMWKLVEMVPSGLSNG